MKMKIKIVSYNYTTHRAGSHHSKKLLSTSSIVVFIILIVLMISVRIEWSDCVLLCKQVNKLRYRDTVRENVSQISNNIKIQYKLEVECCLY